MKPTEQQIAKLPKWAQDHIRSLEREREAAINALNENVSPPDDSLFYCEDYICTGEQQGPSSKRRNFAGNRITCEAFGVALEIIVRERDKAIDLSWSCGGIGANHVAFIPTSFQQAQLISKENLR